MFAPGFKVPTRFLCLMYYEFLLTVQSSVLAYCRIFILKLSRGLCTAWRIHNHASIVPATLGVFQKRFEKPEVHDAATRGYSMVQFPSFYRAIPPNWCKAPCLFHFPTGPGWDGLVVCLPAPHWRTHMSPIPTNPPAPALESEQAWLPSKGQIKLPSRAWLTGALNIVLARPKTCPGKQTAAPACPQPAQGG
jgi:hypothetical protein